MRKKGAGTNSAEHPLGQLAIGSCPIFNADYCGWPFYVNRESVLLAESRTIPGLFAILSPI